MTITEIMQKFDELETKNAQLVAKLAELDERQTSPVVIPDSAYHDQEAPPVKGWDNTEAVRVEQEPKSYKPGIERVLLAVDLFKHDPTRVFVYVAALEYLGYQVIPPAELPASSLQTLAILGEASDKPSEV